jgi:hypothetical protein
MKKATAMVPFPYVGSPGCNYEQLFLTEKLRREQCSTRRSGNGTEMVAIGTAALTPYSQCSEWRGINWQVFGTVVPGWEWS